MTTTTTRTTDSRAGICRRLLSLALCLITLLSLFPISAFAAENTATIHDFSAKTKLTYDQYDALRTGKISAVQKKGVWYYQFKTDKLTLLVKTSAFASSVGNDFSGINATLTSGVMSDTGVPQEARYVYKERAGVRKDARTLSNVYSTYFSYLSVTASRVETEVDLICRKFAQVQFEYSEKVLTHAKGGRNPRGTGAVPSNAGEYMQALKRSTKNIATTVTPSFTLTVNHPGSSNSYLNSAMYRGKGQAKTSANVTDYIDVAVTTTEIAAKVSAGSLTYKDLYSLYKQAVNLKKVSSEYQSNDKIILTKTLHNKTTYCLSSEFSSPIDLKQYDDYFRTEVRLTAAPSATGTKTQMTVTFRAG